MGRRSTSYASEFGDLTRDRLTRDVWLEQRLVGHRFSSDDMVTAWVAVGQQPGARRVLDLGCGIGSVLLHLAWSLPEAELVGVEAQAVSFGVLARNVLHSGYAERVRTLHGDLRKPEVVGSLGGGFDLITGTPPYFPPGSALDAEDEQRAYARIEYRGGVEAYLETAVQLLTEAGIVILCGARDADARVQRACRALNLPCYGRWDVHPRLGEAPLFCVWSFARAARGFETRQLVLRGAAGERTPDAARLRAFSGF